MIVNFSDFLVNILCIAALATLASCQQAGAPSPSQSSSDARPAGGFINPSTFDETGNTEEISPNELAIAISGLDYFYFTQPSNTGDSGLNLLEACQIKKDSITLTHNTLTLDYIYDDSDCPDITSDKINKLRLYASISCSETDLSAYDGSSVRQFIYLTGANDFCPGDSNQQTFVNADIEVITKTTSTRSIGGIMTSSQAPCTSSWNDQEFRLNDCTFYLKKSSKDLTTGAEVTERLISLTAQNLSAYVGDRYYRSGVMNLRFNHWQGEVIYTSPQIGPTYGLTNGETSITGSFQGGLDQPIP